MKSIISKLCQHNVPLTTMHLFFHHLVPGPLNQPGKIDGTTLTSTTVRLDWAPPNNSNGVIAGYRINVAAVSTDPNAFVMGMGGGTGDKRRRRQTPGMGGMNITAACIPGGRANVNRNFTTDGNTLSYSLNNLSECCI